VKVVKSNIIVVNNSGSITTEKETKYVPRNISRVASGTRSAMRHQVA
jgi:hypothetical protein